MADGQATDSNDPSTVETIDGVNVSDVRLTPEEQQLALKAALHAKRMRIGMERLQTMQKIRAMDQQLQGPRSAYELWNLIHARGAEIAQKEGWEDAFYIPDFSYDIYLALCYYFTGDVQGMMKYQLSPRKGLMLFGNIGVGKTVIMDVFARNVVQSYKVIKCAKIVSEFGLKDNAQLTIEKYSVMKANEHLGKYYNQEVLGYCFDDLGAEKMGSNYGKEEAMIDIIENRYNYNHRGPKTHLTTNLSLEQIETRYGLRVLDRMRQMFNLIDFPEDAASLRK